MNNDEDPKPESADETDKEYYEELDMPFELLTSEQKAAFLEAMKNSKGVKATGELVREIGKNEFSEKLKKGRGANTTQEAGPASKPTQG